MEVISLERVAFTYVHYSVNWFVYLLQGRNWLPKTGWASSSAAPSILSKTGWAIAHPAHSPLTPLALKPAIHEVKTNISSKDVVKLIHILTWIELLCFGFLIYGTKN